jgi:hypothetical protein
MSPDHLDRHARPDTLPAAKFFTYAAELLKVDPPHITDQPMIAQLRKIGIEPGKSFDMDKTPLSFAKPWRARPRRHRS